MKKQSENKNSLITQITETNNEMLKEKLRLNIFLPVLDILRQRCYGKVKYWIWLKQGESENTAETRKRLRWKEQQKKLQKGGLMRI